MTTPQFKRRALALAKKEGVFVDTLPWSQLPEQVRVMWRVLHALFRSRTFDRVTITGDKTARTK